MKNRQQHLKRKRFNTLETHTGHFFPHLLIEELPTFPQSNPRVSVPLSGSRVFFRRNCVDVHSCQPHHCSRHRPYTLLIILHHLPLGQPAEDHLELTPSVPFLLLEHPLFLWVKGLACFKKLQKLPRQGISTIKESSYLPKVDSI